MADQNLLKQATSALQDNWSELSKKDINKAKGNIEDLVKTIAEKTGEAASTVSERVNRVVDEATRRRKKKSFLGRIKGFFVGLLKVVGALVAVAAAAAVGLMFWRKRLEQSSGSYVPPAEPPTMDQAAVLHAPEATPPPAAPDESL